MGHRLHHTGLSMVLRLPGCGGHVCCLRAGHIFAGVPGPPSNTAAMRSSSNVAWRHSKALRTSRKPPAKLEGEQTSDPTSQHGRDGRETFHLENGSALGVRRRTMTCATRIGKLMGAANAGATEGVLEGSRQPAAEHAMVEERLPLQVASARRSYSEAPSSGTSRPSRTWPGIVSGGGGG